MRLNRIAAVTILLLASVTVMSDAWTSYLNGNTLIRPDTLTAATNSGGGGSGGGGGGTSTPKPKPLPAPVPVPAPAPAPAPVQPVIEQPDMVLYTMILDTMEVPLSGLPVFVDGTSGAQLQLRGLAGALGYRVDWDAETRSILLSNGIRTVRIWLDKPQFSVDGTVAALAGPPVIRNGYAYLTLSAVRSVFGYQTTLAEKRLVMQKIEQFTTAGEIIQSQAYQDGWIIRVYGLLLDSGKEDTVFVLVGAGTPVVGTSGDTLSMDALSIGQKVIVTYQGYGTKNEQYLGTGIRIIVDQTEPLQTVYGGGSDDDDEEDDDDDDDEEDDD